MSMDIYTGIGSKIIATPISLRNGHDLDKEKAALHLKKNEFYTLQKIERQDWKTFVWVREVPNVPFNSVQFENL